MRYLITIFVILLSGCVNLSIDSTNDKDMWKPFDRDAVYYLKSDLFLLRVSSGKEPARLALVPPSTQDRGSGFYSSPTSINSYLKDPVEASKIKTDNGFFKINIVGIVRKNTMLKPSMIKNNIGWNLWFGKDNYATRYFTILEGQFANKQVDIEDLHWKPQKYLTEKRIP